MKYILDHLKFGFCWWDLVAIIALVVLFFYCRKKIKDMIQQKDELENRLSGQNADTAFKKEEEQSASVTPTGETPSQQE